MFLVDRTDDRTFLGVFILVSGTAMPYLIVENIHGQLSPKCTKHGNIMGLHQTE